MWRGAISFGMVAIPVRMYVATEAHSAVSFRQLCPHCQLPIKQQRHCPTDDHVVAFNDVLKGYEVSKGQYVLMDEEDLDKLPLKTTRTIDIVEFVERNEVPLGLYIKSAYYRRQHAPLQHAQLAGRDSIDRGAEPAAEREDQRQGSQHGDVADRQPDRFFPAGALHR